MLPEKKEVRFSKTLCFSSQTSFLDFKNWAADYLSSEGNVCRSLLSAGTERRQRLAAVASAAATRECRACHIGCISSPVAVASAASTQESQTY